MTPPLCAIWNPPEDMYRCAQIPPCVMHTEHGEEMKKERKDAGGEPHSIGRRGEKITCLFRRMASGHRYTPGRVRFV